jgi:hypothetical protein
MFKFFNKLPRLREEKTTIVRRRLYLSAVREGPLRKRAADAGLATSSGLAVR